MHWGNNLPALHIFFLKKSEFEKKFNRENSYFLSLIYIYIFKFYFLAPHIEILSDAAKHVEHRSALNLTCVVDAVASEASGGQKWPKMVWYKDGKVSFVCNCLFQSIRNCCLRNLTIFRLSFKVSFPKYRARVDSWWKKD